MSSKERVTSALEEMWDSLFANRSYSATLAPEFQMFIPSDDELSTPENNVLHAGLNAIADLAESFAQGVYDQSSSMASTNIELIDILDEADDGTIRVDRIRECLDQEIQFQRNALDVLSESSSVENVKRLRAQSLARNVWAELWLP